tara:strand:+ start:329 stop:502 length:174 start_codon:yes stop_codon:yes gene_type:complete
LEEYFLYLLDLGFLLVHNHYLVHHLQNHLLLKELQFDILDLHLHLQKLLLKKLNHFL